MHEPLRIAIVGQRGVPATFGGVEHHVEEVGARLAQRGHHVDVFCRTNYVPERLSAYRGMRLRYLPTVASKHLEAIVHTTFATIAAFGEGYDVIHYHALGPGVLAPLPRYLSGAKVVQTVHALDYERAKWGRGARAFLRAGEWLSARVPNATIVVSGALADHYRGRYGLATACIPNGVDDPLGRLPADQITERFGLTAGDYVLFVGRLVPEKSPDLLVRAFRSLPGRLRLALVGGSSFTDGYAEHVRRLAADDQRVVMTGYQYGSVLAELYANAAAFVLPSAVEGLPCTLLEALSYGTPVVASAIPPHLELLRHDGPGRRLFRPGDEDDLLLALESSLRDRRSEREGASALRAEILPSYRWDHVVDAIEDVYRRVLDGERVAKPRDDAPPSPVPTLTVAAHRSLRSDDGVGTADADGMGAGHDRALGDGCSPPVDRVTSPPAG